MILIPKSQRVGHTSEAQLNATTKHEIELTRTSSLLLWTPKGLRAAQRSKVGESRDFVELTGQGGIIAFDSDLNIGNLMTLYHVWPVLLSILQLQ